MEPLRGSDPARIGGYRLLRRLGAGGMGVVYLARSTGGSLAAVKVIRGGYADETGFRARFRREVETGGRVSSPWVVPLLDADPDAESPWLVTEFVPGPSLAEAVEECGPLPHASVRFLGARLAEALAAVHGAGLVHRDVKPGNVLLAVDGPRMIDFGIARMPEDTALTASGMVVGSPGFLSPEQAQGRGREIGPASDVFSLGCLLVYAVTGERPFGRGAVAEVLMRTVRAEPYLDGVPVALLPLVRDCLEKDPAARPGVTEVRRTLDGARGTGGEGNGSWSPETLTRLIARRSAAVLALPAVDATEISAASGVAAASEVSAPVAGGPFPALPRPEELAPASTRRRFLVLGSGAGVVAAGGTAAWWSARRPGHASPRASGTGVPRLVIALHADLSGRDRAAGRAQENGVRLAVDDANSRSGRAFELALEVNDDAGGTARAEAIARRLADDDRVRAVIGPTTDACASAALDRYQKALLPLVSVSVGLDSVSATTYRVYAATRPSDSYLAAPIVAYLTRTARAQETVLIDDAAEGDFGWKICTRVSEALRSGPATRRRTLAAGDDTAGAFNALARDVTRSGADAVVFTGGPARAARFARALRAAGFRGTRLATQRALAPAFLTSAGDAAEGWVFASTFVDPTRVSAAKSFNAAYRARFQGAAPPWYAAESYDATLFVARAMTTLGSLRTDRGALVDRLRDTDYRGITRRLNWTSASASYCTDGLYLFRAAGDRFGYLGQYRAATG
ncbi:bifunctional serine/threonine-protein kinase/ABC transporter substrate-binding protein [Streptomyces sp. NPDC005574]|uniref:bifunctional serine/threonine-protein kinase/ABC transporter substrate-binding protein n=1 Tax=Streptomyces sp. NPDC005574 TaxID=3156891 RepID=UPI0033AED1AF